MRNKAKKGFDFSSDVGSTRSKHATSLGIFDSGPGCGTETHRSTACQAPAMANGKCRMHWVKYWPKHHRRAGAVAACALEGWALFCRVPSRAKACASAADPKSQGS